MEKKILHLTLKKQWFDMIKSGEKKEEYREIKPYWNTRFSSLPYDWCVDNKLFLRQFEPHESGFEQDFRHFDIIRFTNGYAKNAPTFDIECKGIHVAQGNPEWGAPTEPVFILSLGNILTHKNTKNEIHKKTMQLGLD